MQHYRLDGLRSAVIVFTLLASGAAPAYEWDVSSWRGPQVGPTAETLGLSGLWPDSCTPRLTAAQLSGETLELRTESQTTACQPSEVLFAIPIQLDHETGTARYIAWFHRRQDEPEYRLYGHRLRDPGALPLLEPSSGWWWPEPGGPVDSGGPGTGITIDHQQGLLTILSQAYEPFGNPEWQLATGPLRGDIFNAPLIRFSHGQTLTGNYQLPGLAVGRDELSLQFHSPLLATAWFSHRRGTNLDSPIDLRSVSLMRYLVNPPILDRLLNGRWLVTMKQDLGGTPAVASFRILAIKESGTDEIQLLNPRGLVIGQCQLEPDRPEAPPRKCTLPALDVFGDLTINSIGYGRMQGSDQNGRAVLVVRIPL